MNSFACAQEAAFQEYRRDKRRERKRRQRGEDKAEDDIDDLDSGVDPEMAAMMGFSGFGGAKRTC